MRVATGLGVTLWCFTFGALLWTLGSNRSLVAALQCFVPSVLALGLSLTSQEDRGQYLARLLACAGFLPVLQLMMAWSNAGDVWRTTAWLLGGLTALLVICFVGSVMWMSRSSTAIAAAPGVQPVSLPQLGARLQSLATLSLALRLQAVVKGGSVPGQWELVLRDPAEPEREHLVLLEVDETSHCVTVRERLRASGAAPRTESEASMRGPGGPLFDPTRPDAQWLSGRVAQTTIVEPAELAGVQLQWGFGGVVTAVVLPPVAQGSEQEGQSHLVRDEAQAWLTLLAAVVTRSGYTWKPTMF